MKRRRLLWAGGILAGLLVGVPVLFARLIGLSRAGD
jgi:hypothetical protein